LSALRTVAVNSAQNVAEGETIIITVYEPDPLLWDASFKRRRR